MLIVALVALVALIFTPKSESFQNFAGGGLNLKEFNAKLKSDSIKTSVGLVLEGSQTDAARLVQAYAIINHKRFYGPLSVGAHAFAVLSNRSGVSAPYISLNMGVDMGDFQLEWLAGDIKRNFVNTCGADPEFTDFTLASGESARAAGAMQFLF